MTWLISIIRLLGPAGCAAVLVVLYYEGAPVVNRLPYVDQIPLIREFGVGRVEIERRAATAGLVKQSELDALSAVLAQERAKSAAAEAMATEARNRATALQRVRERQRDEIERLIEKADKTPGLSYPTKEDLQWRAR
jgi:hypothetical protein